MVRLNPAREVYSRIPIYLVIIAYPVSDTTACSVNNDIGLIFSCQSSGFVDGSDLFSMFAGDTFITFSSHCPSTFKGNNMLVPGSLSFTAL